MILLKRDKKAQAAMEFLMTYGWAILAAIIAIGVLYLIIGNPGNLIGERYTLTAPFVEKAAAASAANGLTIEFTNGAGETVTIRNVSVENCGSNSNTDNVGWTVSTDATQAITIATCTPALVEGDRIRGDITISYNKTDSTVTQTGTGSLNLKVTA